MKIEFLVDYEILQRRKNGPVHDLCINKDGLIKVKDIDLMEMTNSFDGEAILGSVINDIINIKYNLEKQNRIIFYCNFIEMRYYPTNSDAYISITKLVVPNNNLFDCYKKYEDIFQKIGLIIKGLL